ncbi:hypothetical protein KEM54_003836 [Ascosphaera aggregata]|nr:hypothetical protein KEM54_003836 [Ascosphaera aggregata]
MSSSETPEAAKAASSKFSQHPWSQHAACSGHVRRGRVFTIAGVKSVFGRNDHHASSPYPGFGSQQPASGDGAIPADLKEHNREERMLNDRDEKLRAEFNQKLDDLKQSIVSSSQTAKEATGGKS